MSIQCPRSQRFSATYLTTGPKGTLSSLVPDRKACEAFSSEQQTATLVRALEGVPPEEPFIPGAQAIPPSLRGALENAKWLDGAS